CTGADIPFGRRLGAGGAPLSPLAVDNIRRADFVDPRQTHSIQLICDPRAVASTPFIVDSVDFAARSLPGANRMPTLEEGRGPIGRFSGPRGKCQDDRAA